jgi:methyl-accepting chemotaxis protein
LRFVNLKISTKYPIIVVAVSLLAAVVTGVIAYTKFAAELRVVAEEKLTAIREIRTATLLRYLDSIRQDLRFQATNPTVRVALKSFELAWSELGLDATEQLQALYIHDNPHSAGQKENLDQADDGSLYSSVHAIYHPWFRQFLRERGYYDIFLFDPDGNLVYTVFKELDYATNIVTGPWKDTDLANVFRAARNYPHPNYEAFFDFKEYEPSDGAPASFISTAVFDDSGTFIGVLAFQMPIDRINQIMQVSAGMGATGETYIVGQDLRMRSQSRFEEAPTILKTKVDTATARFALEGKTGLAVTLDYRGVPVLSAYAPLRFKATTWAIMAEIDEAEVLAPVRQLRLFMLIVGIGVGVAMTSAMRRLADDDLAVDIPVAERRDEIGGMAEALSVFKQTAHERKRVEADLRESKGRLSAVIDNTVDGIITIDKTGRIEAFNPAAERIFGFAAAEVIGESVNVLMPPPFREEHDAYIKSYLDTGIKKIISSPI